MAFILKNPVRSFILFLLSGLLSVRQIAGRLACFSNADQQLKVPHHPPFFGLDFFIPESSGAALRD